MLDLLLVGGGLANGLLAARLFARRPEVSFALIEGGPTLGGNHTWCFHGGDVTAGQRAWLAPLCAKSWTGYDVRFPGTERTLSGAYHAVRSADFDRDLRRMLGSRVRTHSPVAQVEADRVTLASGERVEARAVIDGRGTALDVPVGFQKFLGQEWVLDAPHGLERPLLMDATVEQLGGFRFLYALPWSERTVLVEDTCYSNEPALDLPALRERIPRWIQDRGWRAIRMTREESGALPLPLGGRLLAQRSPVLGVAAGLFHATTGYSLPVAAAMAESLCDLPQLDLPSVRRHVDRFARKHWKEQSFFRMLNRMLFLAASPADRVRVFASFYEHDEALISRFYAGALTAQDKVRALARGAPTLRPFKAVRAALRR